MNSAARIVYDYFQHRWFLSSFVLTSSTTWFSILSIFGKDLGIHNKQNDLIPIFSYITWTLVVVSILFAILKTLADKYNEKSKNDGQYVLEKLLQSVNSGVTKKMNRFCSYIKKNNESEVDDPFMEITQPQEQIVSILENVQITLSDLFGIRRNCIGISIIYKHHVDWDWLCNIDNTGDLSLSDILSNPDCTAKQIIDGKKSFIFHPDKRVGKSKNEYVSANVDDSHNMIGSILSQDISIGHDDFRVVLNISTYGQQFCEEGDEETKKKILNILLPPFIMRIQLELALLHIKYLREIGLVHRVGQLDHNVGSNYIKVPRQPIE